MGLWSYNVLSDKLALALTKPLEAEFKRIVDTLASYYEPKSYELVELYKRYQKVLFGQFWNHFARTWKPLEDIQN
jgi:hypothetical protein